MTFPTTPLTVQTQLLLGGTWTDISSDVYARDDGVISITRGRPDEASTFDPAELTFDLNNRSGKYSPRNPTSPYYGLIGRNTPIRVSVLTGSSYLDAEGAVGDYAWTADNAALHVTGDLDVRVDAALTNWTTSSVGLVGRWGGSTTTRSWRLDIDAGLIPLLTWTPDGTTTNLFESFATVPLTIPPGGRIALRATLDVNNGSGGSTTTFYTAPTSAGPWTQLGAAVTQAGTTSINAGAAPLRIADVDSEPSWTPAAGRVYSVQMLSGIGGTAVADPDFTAQTPGAPSFTDAAGRVWTVTGHAELTNRNVRFCGEVTSWPPRWDASSRDVYVPITAAGPKRRLGQGSTPLQSPLQRAALGTYTPLAYWTLEDEAGSTMAASAVGGGRAIAPTGITFAADSTLPGSLPLPTIAAGGHLTAPIPADPGAPWWGIEAMVKLPAVLPATLTLVWQVAVAGMIPASGAPVAAVQMLVSVSSVRLLLVDDSGSTLSSVDDTTAGDVAALASAWCRVSIGADGSSGLWQLTWAPAGTSVLGDLFLSPGGTIGCPTQVTTGTVPASLGGMAVGHLAAYEEPGWAVDPLFYGADVAYAGETAGTRLVRIAAEENLPLVFTGQPAQDEAMGEQAPAALLDTLQACADADGGLLYEPREVVGLAYRDRLSLYNQAPAVMAYSDLVPPLEPTDDDQRTQNDITVQRIGGVSARAVQTTGPLSVSAPPAGVGPYSTSVSLALATDDQPPQIASWLRHLGTVDQLRYPVITVYLQRRPALIAAISALDIGSRLEVTNPPLALLPPGAIDQLVEGYTETIAQYRWEFAINAGPASPWSVGTLDDPVYGRIDTDGSTLASAVGASDTTISVASTATPWTTDQSQTPWDVQVGGERLTVSALGTSMSTNPFFATDASGWTAVSSTIAWSTAQLYSGATGAVLVTPNGTSASGGVQQSPHSPVASVTPGASYLAFGWVYSPGGWSDLRAVIDWYDATDTLLSTGLGTATVVAAGVWTFLEQTLVAPASASRGAVRIRHAGTPPSSATYYAWGIRWVPVTSVSASSPQTMSVIRSVNGVVKAQASGSDVRLADPTIIAL